MLYKIHVGMLMQKSEAFNAIFSIPSGKDNPSSEGRTTDNPIFLDQVTSEEFSDLIDWIYKM